HRGADDRCHGGLRGGSEGHDHGQAFGVPVEDLAQATDSLLLLLVGEVCELLELIDEKEHSAAVSTKDADQIVQRIDRLRGRLDPASHVKLLGGLALHRLAAKPRLSYPSIFFSVHADPDDSALN